MQAINRNANFNNVEMKQVSTACINAPKEKSMFDPNTPEGAYSIDMESVYDRIILQNLLDIDEKLVGPGSEGEPGERGGCFIDAKLGTASWSLPETRDKYGNWELEESEKELTFTFKLPGGSSASSSAGLDMRPTIEQSALQRYGEILMERRELDDGDG